MNSRVAVIVLNWNCAEDTITCVESLLTQTYRNMSIFIVDNNSSDSSKEVLKSYTSNKPRVKLITNSKNKGFAGGINTGIQEAFRQNMEFIGTLNPDAVADKNWVSALIEGFSKQNVGTSVGALVSRDGKIIDSCGESFSNWGLSFPRLRNLPSIKIPIKNELVFGATGGAVIYRASMLRKIGLYDENFFMYYEDADLSFRSQLYGYRVNFSSAALAYHDHGTSAKKVKGLVVYHAFKNMPLLVIKNVPLKLLLNTLPRFWLAYILMAGNAIKNGNGIHALRGYLEHLLLFWRSSLWQRFDIQQGKKVSDEYIESILWKDLPPDQMGLRKFRDFFTDRR